MPSSMVINTNIASLTSQKYLSRTNDDLQVSIERLSSGVRVNSAKDDAAGLAIADRMTSQVRGMTVATRNANDGVSMAQTAEAGMGTITETLQRMRDLAVQAANFGAVSDSDRDKLQTEFKQLGLEIKRIIKNTEFNGKKILNGSLQGANFQIGPNTTTDNQISVTVSDLINAPGISGLMGTHITSTFRLSTPNLPHLSTNGNTYFNPTHYTLTKSHYNLGIGGTLGITSVFSTNGNNISMRNQIAGQGNVLSAISTIDKAITKIDTFRANLGAIQNRFATTIANLQSSIENQSTAKSRIMDADFATETAKLARAQILQQAGTAMLAQANQTPRNVLELLK